MTEVGLNDRQRWVAGQQSCQLLLLRERIEPIRRNPRNGTVCARTRCRAGAIPPRPRPTSWWFMASLRVM